MTITNGGNNMSELTQDQKRIRIAEACGWKRAEDGFWDYRNDGRGIADHMLPSVIPDYFGDLNAAHAMEKAICDRRLSYYIELQREMDTVDSTLVISATAAQRAEAFGRTLNLW